MNVGHKVPEESRGNGERPDEVLLVLPVVQVDELADAGDVLRGPDLGHQRDEGQRGQGQEEGQAGQEAEAPDELRGTNDNFVIIGIPIVRPMTRLLILGNANVFIAIKCTRSYVQIEYFLL